MDDTQTTADRIIVDATESLEAIDAEIRDKRLEREEINNHIAALLEERKPLARIVSAANGRRSPTKVSDD